MRTRTMMLLSLATGLGLAGSASALTVPFTESFDVDGSGWTDANEVGLVYVASGGADGGGYVTNNVGVLEGNGSIVFQARPVDGASGGAFEGDWASNVSELTAYVRHDAPSPLTFFFRVTCCDANFPGAVGIVPIPVLPNTWTEISLDVFSTNPLIIPEAGTFFTTFTDTENLQIGAAAPTGFELVPFHFDLDLVSIVPEPGTGLLLGGGLLALGVRRRSR